MDISFDSQKNLLFPLNNENEYNNSFNMEDGNFLCNIRRNDFFIDNNEYDFDIPFCFGNENSLDYNQRRGNCFLMIYPIHKIRGKVIIFLSNTKLLFENKKELSPKILYENGIK